MGDQLGEQPSQQNRHSPPTSARRRWRVIAVGWLLSVILWLGGGGDRLGSAQAVELDAPVPPPQLSVADQADLDGFRLDRRINQSIDRALVNSAVLRDRVELEVDRAFDHFTTTLNILLTLLTAVPIAIAVGVWLLRRSVISELVDQVRDKIETEITDVVKRQRDLSVHEIETLKQGSLNQLNQMVADAQANLAEIDRHAEAIKQEIELLKAQATIQLQSMVTDAQTVKDDTIQELGKLLPASPQDPLPPDLQPRLGRLTAILDSLKSVMPQLTFSVGDYIKQGNAFFFESRYDEAIASYDKAIQLNPEVYEAWFGRASVLLLSQQYEEAEEAYHQAIILKPDAYEAHFGQASAYRKLQNFAGAIVAYDRAIQLRADQPKPWYNKACCQAAIEDVDGVIISLTQAIQLNPDKYREMAKTDVAFEAIKTDDRLQALLQG